MAGLQLKESVRKDLDSFIVRGQELLKRLHEAGDAVSATFFYALIHNVDQGGTKILLCRRLSTRLRISQLKKMLQNFHETTPEKQKEQRGSVAQAVKRDFKKRPRKETALNVVSLDALP